MNATAAIEDAQTAAAATPGNPKMVEAMQEQLADGAVKNAKVMRMGDVLLQQSVRQVTDRLIAEFDQNLRASRTDALFSQVSSGFDLIDKILRKMG